MGWMGRCNTFRSALFSARPMIPPYAGWACTWAACSSRKARPQALATASGSGLSCVSTSARQCDRATDRSFRSRKRNCSSDPGGSSRSTCGEGGDMKVRTLRVSEGSRNASPPARRTRLDAELLQSREAGAIPFGRDLQVARDIPKTLIIHDLAKCERPDLALADVLVPVDPATQRLHAVVEVERLDQVEPDDPIELVERLVVSPLGREVVASREDVAGIDADRDASGVLAQLTHRAQLFEAASQARPLSGSGLEQDLAAASLRAEDAVEGLGHVAESALLVRIRPGMDDEMRDAEEVAALQLVYERGDRLLSQVARIGTQVDEVAGVDRDRHHRRCPKGTRVRRGDLFRPPHPAGFGEDLHGLGAIGEGAGDGLVPASRGAFVCSQQHRVAQCSRWG